MWSRCFNAEKIMFVELLFAELQTTKLKGIHRKIIKRKNQFLLKNNNIVHKTANFFVFKGFKLKYLKIFNYASLFFFRHLNKINPPKTELKKFSCHELMWDIIEYPTVSKLVNESYLYYELGTLVPLFLMPSLPMIKTLCLTKKYLKKKKALKTKLPKYSLHYVYVPHSQRALVVLRWFGMLVKTHNARLVNSFIDVTLNTAKNDENSFIVKIKNQVYAGLSFESDY